ncbi:MAG TPA: GDP-mannose 4,6-dehydratase [Acidimicrobiales bacterium]|nr:GDP-mannose 4,6-dehydratase [Acidimicrobiales bacterium]
MADAAHKQPAPQDDPAFEDVYRAHRASITAYIRRRLGGDEAGDVVAQVFCVAWRRREDLPAPPEDLLWLYGVARRAIADHRRASLRRRRLEQRLQQQPQAPSLDEGFGSLTSQVDTVMGRLSAGEQSVIEAVIWEGVSLREVAERLGCTPNAAEIRYRRARSRFREIFLALNSEMAPPGLVPRQTDEQQAGEKQAGEKQAKVPAVARATKTNATPTGGRMPRALITGITGQDGRYLAELLIGKGYQVSGMVRGQDNPKARLVQDEVPEVELVNGDLTDLSSLIAVVEQVQPDEVYNLGAISFVKLSFTQPELTANVSGSGVLRILEAVRIVGGRDNKIRFYQASTSEMFGEVSEVPQRESTPFHPRSPYGTAKVFGYYTTLNYRESYGLHASNGILFNHTSPRRGLEFVERKITNAVARISLGLQDSLTLGNLDATRDFGYAGDYVEAMWRMLQQSEGSDYVVATGKTWSVRQILDMAFASVGIEDWSRYVASDPRFYRPAEVDHLVGDPSRAHDVLGWEPKVEFPEVLEEMVRNDIELEHSKAALA